MNGRGRILRSEKTGFGGLVFRRATAADGVEIGRLASELHAMHASARPDFFTAAEPYPREEFLRVLEGQSEEFHVAERPDGRLAAYALLAFRQAEAARGLKGRFFCNVDELCVDKDCRGQGIGRAFFAYLEDRARMGGARSLELTVWCFNARAEAFYREVGMKPRVQKLEKKL